MARVNATLPPDEEDLARRLESDTQEPNDLNFGAPLIQINELPRGDITASIRLTMLSRPSRALYLPVSPTTAMILAPFIANNHTRLYIRIRNRRSLPDGTQSAEFVFAKMHP